MADQTTGPVLTVEINNADNLLQADIAADKFGRQFYGHDKFKMKVVRAGLANATMTARGEVISAVFEVEYEITPLVP
jgi:hypothetical protein